MHTHIIINQIIIMSILVGVGAIGSLAGVINEKARNSISRIVFNITLPLLIITTFSNMKLNNEIITNGIWVIIFSILSFIIMNFIGLISTKSLKMSAGSSSVHRTHTMFGNIVFLGFPLIDALFPNSESLLYAALYYLVSSAIQWTYGIYLLSDKGGSIKKNLKNLLNPNTLSFVIGVLLMVLHWKIPEFIFNALQGMGKTTIYLSMLYIGALLVGVNIKGMFKRLDIYLLSLNKLLIIPFLLLWLINLAIVFFNIPLGEMAKTIVVMETGMPCMTMIVIISKNVGANDKMAAENVFLTTLLSLISLPFLYYLIGIL